MSRAHALAAADPFLSDGESFKLALPDRQRNRQCPLICALALLTRAVPTRVPQLTLPSPAARNASGRPGLLLPAPPRSWGEGPGRQGSR
jgi:hypothetical protein